MKNILLVVLGVIVLAGVALVVVFALAVPRGAGPTPLASASASEPASASPAAAPSAVPTPRATTHSATDPSAGPGDTGDVAEPAFASGSATVGVACPVPGEGPAGSTAVSPEVQLTWSSTGAETAFVGVDTSDARAEPYSGVDTSGSISLPFACPAGSHTYTLTLVGEGGQRSRSFTVQNTGYRG